MRENTNQNISEYKHFSCTLIRNLRLEIVEKIRSSRGTSPTEILEKNFFSIKKENVYVKISVNVKEHRK